jgi:hypothetical protein
MIERWNSEGIPRDQLVVALRTPRIVRFARRINSCLLCRRKSVNEAGICEVCTANILDAEELRLIGEYRTGERA